MIKRHIKYTDFNGVEKEKDYYFHLSEAEIAEMELSTGGGLIETIQAVAKALDGPELVKIFKEFLLKAYGEKSADGELFLKSEEISHKFSCTPAYSILYMELSTDADKAAEFFKGVIPEVKDKKVAENTTPALN